MNKNMLRRSSKRDVEAELNLPPGFHFHPTDEELLVHYLCRKVNSQCLPVPIIPEVDLYRYDPWQLPEMALFGTKEWYFFSPRDRKYPNGLRPNRAAGHGYWKATGADKPIRPRGCTTRVGIKKALVFYSGKAPSGVKTNRIMHEYRLAEPNRPSNDKTSLRLDGWVLCRIYNKKNNWEKIESHNINDQEPASEETAHSSGEVDHDDQDGSRTPESGSRNIEPHQQQLAIHDHQGLPADHQGKQNHDQALDGGVKQTTVMLKEDNYNWFMNYDSDDLHNSLVEFGATFIPDLTYQDYCFSGLWSPHSKTLRTSF